MLILDLGLAVCAVGPETGSLDVEGALGASRLLLHDLDVDKVFEIAIEL